MPIPPEVMRNLRHYWKVLECTHDYNHSPYYAGDADEKLCWEGYDAMAQTQDAREYIRSRDRGKPFLLVLSWGPPHAPYHTAPEKYRETVAHVGDVSQPLIHTVKFMADSRREVLPSGETICLESFPGSDL